MNCPNCNYLMSERDLDCPRCAKFGNVQVRTVPPTSGFTPGQKVNMIISTILVLIVIGIIVLGNSSAASEEDHKIIDAAKQGACSHLGMLAPMGSDGCTKMGQSLDTCSSSIVRLHDNEARVVFSSNGATFASATVVRDKYGYWNPE